jgi:hypothetical protein
LKILGSLPFNCYDIVLFYYHFSAFTMVSTLCRTIPT